MVDPIDDVNVLLCNVKQLILLENNVFRTLSATKDLHRLCLLASINRELQTLRYSNHLFRSQSKRFVPKHFETSNFSTIDLKIRKMISHKAVLIIPFIYLLQFNGYCYAAPFKQDGNRLSVHQALQTDWNAAEQSCISRGETIRVVEIALEYDSTYCTEYGNGNAAATESVIVEAIRAATYPYMTQFCVLLKPVELIGHCGDVNDPFNNMDTSSSRASLTFFGLRWQQEFKDVHRDVSILFSGRDHSAAGAAWTGTMCGQTGNILVTNRSPINIAHEIGHTFGAPHLDSGNGIMHPGGNIGGGPFEFTSSSRDVIKNFLDGSQPSCVEADPAQVSPSPPTGWDCAPQHYNANDGCDCGCGVRDPDCDDPEAVLYCNSLDGEGEGDGETSEFTCGKESNVCE